MDKAERRLGRVADTEHSLEEHLERIERYMHGCGLVDSPGGGTQRRELADFLRRKFPQALAEWLPLVAAAFGIAEKEWAQVRTWMLDALGRWARHIENPEDIETYVFLRDHARHAFISRFPASRFLGGQMKMYQILANHLSTAYAADPDKRDALLALFQQAFQERILHISDFFVEAREEELREQEASYRQIVDNAPAALLQVSLDGETILDANIVAEKTLGYPRQRMLSMPLWNLIPPNEAQGVARLLEDTRTNGHAAREDLHLQARDGAQMPVFFSCGLIEQRHRPFIQLICVNISERRRLEGQLIQSEKMAAVGQLAAGIAHEIRNPLGIITNALYDLGQLVDADNDDVTEDLRIAREEMGRVQSIINNLLEFSRESRAEIEPVNINELLSKTLRLMHKSLQDSDVRVITEFGPLGPCRANQNALRQVILNLITNAVQAMPNGGELRLKTAPLLDGRVQLQVTDSGMGIPPEHLNDIFNPFFSTKAPGQGTGLGLSVVHSVLKRYHGDIRVHSEINRGTTFTIELPCPCEDEGGESLATDASATT
jgi:PAS domain S-box-containing protein